MIVLGIDPGTRHLGWGVVEVRGARVSHVAHGVLHTDATRGIPDRLVEIDDGLAEIVRAHAPRAAAVESIFFAKDAQAAAKLGHARGAILLRLRREDVEIAEYPPAKVKRALVGRGAADKAQVARVVMAILGLRAMPPLDATDALALAILHARVVHLPAPLRVSPVRPWRP